MYYFNELDAFETFFQYVLGSYSALESLNSTVYMFEYLTINGNFG